MVIGCVLATVVVVAAAAPHRIAGSAVATPVPGPPAVGDCVLDPLPDSAVDGAVVNAPMRAADPAYPQLRRVQPCAGDRYGEVMAVLDRPARLAVRGDDAEGRFLDDPNWDNCFQEMPRYLGVPANLLSGVWRAGPMTTVALFAPNSRQRAAGQHWASCVVTPRAIEQIAPDASSAHYRGTLRDAYRSGNQRNRLGYCSTSTDFGAGVELTACASPHRLELFAYGDSGDHTASRNQFQTSCRQAVGSITGIDITDFAGQLDPAITVTDSMNDLLTGDAVPPHSSLVCGVASTSSRQLGGSLLALGRAPIPWA